MQATGEDQEEVWPFDRGIGFDDVALIVVSLVMGLLPPTAAATLGLADAAETII